MTMTFDLRFYVNLLLTRLHYVIAIFVLTTAAGVFLAYTLPPVYRAEARLLVESPQIPDELASTTVRSSSLEILLAIQERLLTQTNLLRIAEKYQIFDPAADIPDDTKATIMRRAILIGLPPFDNRTGVVTVAFEADDPVLSAAVTNDFVNQILEENIALRTGASGGTLDFFEQEVKRLSEELARQNARILQFEKENTDALPESLEYRRTRQSTQQERLLQVDRELAGLRDRRQRLADLYDRTGRVGPSAADLTPEQVRLEEMRQELASALVIYAPDNPRVRALQTQVAALEEAVRTQAGGASGGNSVSAFDLQIGDIDAQIDFLAAQKEQLERELRQLDESIRATPANAIRLGELQSDFENLRVQYDQAVQSLAGARMGDRIEATSRGQRITVIDPATEPSAPAEPNRKLIVAAGFAAGGVLTAAMFFLLDVLNRTVRRPAELVTSLGITPFGTIPYMSTRAEEARRRRLVRTAITAGVIGLLVLALLILSLGDPPILPFAADTLGLGGGAGTAQGQ